MAMRDERECNGCGEACLERHMHCDDNGQLYCDGCWDDLAGFLGSLDPAGGDDFYDGDQEV